ncbi:hypothetical protein [Nocardioides sp. cx-173]|uniref:hypothetical protein n=1 Tax=Nocardioides sp. cx-173 TaxID=2898796 RepID=UPI001E57DD6E|nr:hypothetical protein [Nocardioides sp. cx-173]MCD4526794.1 hypothetical protein [Nocardioides sp. cx-173]UGB43897.1 hypothetical protein LQ940_10355 [Nocardioides sp. cx-173]
MTRDHVLDALSEYDERGSAAFLRTYGFGGSRDYVVWHEGNSYDANAVLGVAHKYATGKAASRAHLARSLDGAGRLLTHLGFDVTQVDASGLVEQPVSGEWRDAADLALDESRDAWAEAAHATLLEVAGEYHRVLTTKELAVQVQNRTGIRTQQQTHYWLGDVLTRVAARCAREDEPMLTAFCVNADGSVGASYAPAVLAATGTAPEDADEHAAQQRLLAHQRYGADLPAGGGVAALTPKLAAARGRERKIRYQEREIPTCPNCYMQLPATGVCDNCA